VFWIGTQDGSLIEVDLDSRQSASHALGASVTALGTTAHGALILATGDADIALVSVTHDHAATHVLDAAALRGQVAAFLASTSVVPDDRELWKHLVMSDGVRTWSPDDLATVTTATEADPAWLWTRASANQAQANRRNSD
jgi:hypothetical protein